MGFLKRLKNKARNQALTMAEQSRRLPPMPPRSEFNPFRDPPREGRRPIATPVNPNIQSVRDFVDNLRAQNILEDIETGALPPAGMSMPVGPSEAAPSEAMLPTAPNEAGLLSLPRPRNRFRLVRGRKRLPRFLRDRMPSRFTVGGLGSILEKIFGQLEREDELRRLPFREDMPMERFPMMRPRFAAGDEVDMDMMMADQAARQGISPAEQRMMMIQKTAADMGRTVSDRDAQLFGMGEISFEEAMSRARPSMDRVSGERNLMQQEQMFFPQGDSFDPRQIGIMGAKIRKNINEVVQQATETANMLGQEIRPFVDAVIQGYKEEMQSDKYSSSFYDLEKKFAQSLAEGGPVESEIDKALEDIQSVQPDAMVIQQVMTMVMEMIQSGASEEQIVAALKEMGLDDEDIQQVMMMIAEQMQGQDPIQSELSQMM